VTDREALYRAVLADPDDDTLRLVYADALEEEGDSRRAAFVRSQIELARLPEYDPACVRSRCGGWANPVADWVLDLPELPEGLGWAREPFRRGFPAAIDARDAAAFVTHADDLFARFPIESLDLAVAQVTHVREFAACEWLSRLTRLAVAEGLGGQAATRLLGSAHYERLRELHIGAGLSTATTGTAIVRSRVFKQLTTLSCRDDRAGGRTLVNELTRLADPPRLKSLDLSGNRLTAEQLGPLLAAPALAAVEELNLSDNNLRAAAVGTIAVADLPRLRSLHLFRTQPEEAGVHALAHSELFAGLRGLSLGGNNLPPSVAASLAAGPGAANLRVLDLRDNRLGDAGATTLAESPHLRNLVHLDLASNLIEDDGAEALADSAHLGGLICLDLHGNIISPAGKTRLKRRFGDRVFV
jgi:uncharacterized protein (TIGR02996 family)